MSRVSSYVSSGRFPTSHDTTRFMNYTTHGPSFGRFPTSDDFSGDIRFACCSRFQLFITHASPTMCSAFNRLQLLAILLYLRRRRRRREYWVHPLLIERYIDGAFYTLYNKLRAHENKFFNYFRMSSSTFDYLLYNLTDAIRRQDTNMRLCIPPKEMLAVTIRYLASGNSFTDMQYYYRLGISTISNIVELVCCKIWDLFHRHFLAAPNTDKWKSIAKEYMQRAHFPNCIGAVDGKHIRIEKFPKSGSMNFNYKHYHSIVLMAIVDSDYRFVYVDIGSYGKDCDSAIFQRTKFYELLTQDNLEVPTCTPLHPSSNIRLPYMLVGDEAFQLTRHLLRPYSGSNLDVKKRIFNYRLCRARRYVECAFGILANKWRIFHRSLNVSKKFSKDMVKACVVLHNIVREKDGYRSQDLIRPQTPNGLQDLPTSSNTGGNRNANEIRNQFAEYFVSPVGSLPWQMDKI